jgi:anti-sigma regulatory factor (Ser/Thr protein kinase)
MSFSLFCAYPSSIAFPLDEVSTIRDLHTSMVAGPPRHIDAELSQTFVSSTWSLRAARRFVSTTMRAWGFDGVAADAELIASELATNAVSHARSHFSIGLSRHGSQVRIAVGDSDNTPPIARARSRANVGGLGLHLVESLATCWGYEIDSHGKIVWADVACQSASAA